MKAPASLAPPNPPAWRIPRVTLLRDVEARASALIPNRPPFTVKAGSVGALTGTSWKDPWQFVYTVRDDSGHLRSASVSADDVSPRPTIDDVLWFWAKSTVHHLQLPRDPSESHLSELARASALIRGQKRPATVVDYAQKMYPAAFGRKVSPRAWAVLRQMDRIVIARALAVLEASRLRAATRPNPPPSDVRGPRFAERSFLPPSHPTGPRR